MHADSRLDLAVAEVNICWVSIELMLALVENDGRLPPPLPFPPPAAQRNREDLCKTMQHNVFKRGQVKRGGSGEYSNYGVA